MALTQDIVSLVKRNRWFREVVLTGPHAQVVVMNIPPGGEIGEEVHDAVDQVLVFIEGEGAAVIEGERTAVGPDRLVLVPAGTRHNFINTGSSEPPALHGLRPATACSGNDPPDEGRGGRGRARSADTAGVTYRKGHAVQPA